LSSHASPREAGTEAASTGFAEKVSRAGASSASLSLVAGQVSASVSLMRRPSDLRTQIEEGVDSV